LQSNPADASGSGRVPVNVFVPARTPVEEVVDVDKQMLAAELSALVSSDRPLFASEERRRRWLLEELAHHEHDSHIAEVRDLIAAWDTRQEPPLPPPRNPE
jgi:hypothetical protein